MLCLHSTGLRVATASAPGNTLKISVMGSFAGGLADFGVPRFNGIVQAVDEIHAVSGYLGRTNEIVHRDDQANPDIGLKMSQELVAEKVVATLGFCNTGVAAKSLEVYQTRQLPLTIPCATGQPLTAKYPAPDRYVFCTLPGNAIQAPFAVDDIIKRSWDKVAIFSDSSGYGEAGLKDVEATLADELKAARAAGANVMFSCTVDPENAVIASSSAAPDIRPSPSMPALRFARPSLSQTTNSRC